jgi:hypothetical protein
MVSLKLRFIAVCSVLFLIACGTSSITRRHTIVGSGALPPTITLLEPQSAPVGAVAFTMTVVGKDFGPDAIVYWNGIPTHTTPLNAHQLLADLTVEDLQIAGLVNVYVRTLAQNSNTVTFEVSVQ